MAVSQATTHRPTFTHSREGSNASSISIPITPTFSARGHSCWPSSSSSLAESPTLSKSPLGDLVEETEEHDDPSYLAPSEPFNDQVCMCDTPFCIHEPRSRHRSTLFTALPEWSSGDDIITSHQSRSKRRVSSEYSIQTLSNKFSRRFPSISRRWRDSQPTTSLSSTHADSPTPLRSSSMRLPKVRSSLTNALDSPPRPERSYSISSSFVWPTEDSTYRHSPNPINIPTPPSPINEEPIDRQSMSRTPLLPPLHHDVRETHDNHMMQSPLQSPSVATTSVASSVIHSPVSIPAHGIYTPPLSTSPSCTSFHRYNHMDIPPMDLGCETDPWALKLGHANFHIYPQPYVPDECTTETCRRLLEDWEAARTEYMRQAARVSDDYGPNSNTYHLTEEKWAEIDAQWRANHKLVNAKAEAVGEAVRFQPLAQTAPTQKMPSIYNNPNLPAKFPVVDESNIVGPMVQYVKIASASPPKKPGLLRLITDSASLFAKTPFHLRR